jgi:hypothetical protein
VCEFYEFHYRIKYSYILLGIMIFLCPRLSETALLPFVRLHMISPRVPRAKAQKGEAL